MLSSITNVFFVLLFSYCGISVLYLFVFSLTGKLFYKKNMSVSVEPIKRIGVLVPAYKEDGIILATARNLVQLNYPSELYDVFIIADSFQEETLKQLRELPLCVIEVSFDKSTKTKALNAGFSYIKKEYDIALICDADNILANDFLRILDHSFSNGARAVQGRRVAKNLDSSFAILDACSEAINNNIFRKGANALGLSSAVIGSGMAFEFEKIKNILGEIDAVGGFDKPLQLKIVEQGIKIQYLEEALIFDEKVDSSYAFKQQRKRWVSSQFIYLKKFFMPAVKQLAKGNLSYFNLAIANNLVLPRAFLLLILPALVVVTLFISPSWAMLFTVIWILYLFSLFLALPAMLVNKDLFYAIFKLPKAIGAMIAALFEMKKANKTFIHTVHTKTEVTNTLFNDKRI